MNVFLLFLLFSNIIFAKGAAVNEDPIKIKRYDFHEFVVSAKAAGGNAFFDAGLTGKFTAPSGKIIRI